MMFPLPERRRSHHEGSPRYQTDLLQKGQVVFQMPVVGDAIAMDGQRVNGDEVDPLTDAFMFFEHPGEMTCEAQMGDDAIASENLLGHDDLQVWDGSEKRFRGGGGARGALRTAGRQGGVHEGFG